MKTFVRDTFTDTTGKELSLHTGELGASWATHPLYTGTTAISSANRAYGSSGTAGYYTSGILPKEHVITARFYIFSAISFFGICTRLNTTANVMYLLNCNPAGSVWQIFKNNGSGFVMIDQTAQTFSVGQTYDVRFEVKDARKRLIINNTVRLSITDNEITGTGRVGIRTGAASDNTGAHLDSLSAYSQNGLLLRNFI